MKGSERNKKCPCGSGKKWKNCCNDMNFSSETKDASVQNQEPVPKEVMEYFRGIQIDSEFLKKLGIYQNDQQIISRVKEGYLVPLENAIFSIKADEALTFYEVIGVIAMETLGNDWIENEGKKDPINRSEIYQIISILGATDTFKKVISYTGKKIGSSAIPNSGFSKNFLTLAYDIFCLRRHGFLPKTLVERLKKFDQFQGARYEIAVAAIFCRLGYNIEWLDDRNAENKHPEFIATKEDKRIYVEAKSRHLEGVHNKRGSFNETKALKSSGWGGLINKALQKQVPSGYPYIVFIDMNAINGDGILPNWIKDVRKTLAKQHLKKYEGKEAPFTSIIFTNYSYHYQGLNHAEKGVCFSYENEMTERPYNDTQEKHDVLNAIKHYGFIPDYHIPGQMTILQSQSEYPRINNIPKLHSN